MPTLIKGDDIRSGTKANALHGWFTGGTGVNGLNNRWTLSLKYSSSTCVRTQITFVKDKKA